MKVNCFYWILFALIVNVTSAFADSDIRIVKAEFNRCSAVIDRFERSLRRYEETVSALERSAEQLSAIDKEVFSREIVSFQNRREYFRNLFERILGQADKITDDLNNVSGPICPSCISSNINLYCRSSETLQHDINEYLSKITDLYKRIILKNKSSTTPSDTLTGKEIYSQRCITLDSLLQIVQSCDDPVAVTLRTQGVINLKRADSLIRHHNTPSALTVLDIAESLLQKTFHMCNK